MDGSEDSKADKNPLVLALSAQAGGLFDDRKESVGWRRSLGDSDHHAGPVHICGSSMAPLKRKASTESAESGHGSTVSHFDLCASKYRRGRQAQLADSIAEVEGEALFPVRKSHSTTASLSDSSPWLDNASEFAELSPFSTLETTEEDSQPDQPVEVVKAETPLSGFQDLIQVDVNGTASSPVATEGPLPREMPSMSVLTQAKLAPSKKAGPERKSGHTPRPPNAWILYRSDQLKIIREDPVVRKKPQADISKIISALWREEKREVKLWYEQQAELKKLEHSLCYPEYKYTPQPRKKKGSTAQPSRSPRPRRHVRPRRVYADSEVDEFEEQPECADRKPSKETLQAIEAPKPHVYRIRDAQPLASRDFAVKSQPAIQLDASKTIFDVYELPNPPVFTSIYRHPINMGRPTYGTKSSPTLHPEHSDSSHSPEDLALTPPNDTIDLFKSSAIACCEGLDTEPAPDIESFLGLMDHTGVIPAKNMPPFHDHVTCDAPSWPGLCSRELDRALQFDGTPPEKMRASSSNMLSGPLEQGWISPVEEKMTWLNSLDDISMAELSNNK